MKRTITTILLFLSIASIGQITINPQMLKVGWAFASSYIMKNVHDPLTKEIINRAIPKIIDQDVRGTVNEIAESIYKIKNIKVLNKEFLDQLEQNINEDIKAIQKQDYATAVNSLVKTVSFANTYIKKGTLDVSNPPPSSNTNTANSSTAKTDNATNESNTNKSSKADNTPAEPIISKKELDSKLFISKYNDYVFFVPNGSYKQENYNGSEGEANAFASQFNFNLDNGKKFAMRVANIKYKNAAFVNVEQMEADKEKANQIKSSTAEMMKNNYGEGEIIKSEISPYSNFKALKYTYRYTDKTTNNPSMAYTLISFPPSSMFYIIFNTSANEFSETSKSFDELMKTFKISGIDELPNSNASGSKGSGSGIMPAFSFNLSGRKLLQKPSILISSQDTGKVVVGIMVDKDGNVKSAIPGASGTTTKNTDLFNKTKETSLTAKFNADPNGNNLQMGTMTFVFLKK